MSATADVAWKHGCLEGLKRLCRKSEQKLRTNAMPNDNWKKERVNWRITRRCVFQFFLLTHSWDYAIHERSAFET